MTLKEELADIVNRHGMWNVLVNLAQIAEDRVVRERLEAAAEDLEG